MDGHSGAYYPQQHQQSMYTTREGYGGGGTIPAPYLNGQHPPACIYQRGNNDGYGGHSMAVVEQGGHLVANSNANVPTQGVQAGVPGHNAAVANTTPAHMQSVNSHLMNNVPMSPVAQPPPAHSHNPPSPVSSVTGHAILGGAPTVGNNNNNNNNQQAQLQYPWMKTTKSHAHQWKAQWPGRNKFFFFF